MPRPNMVHFHARELWKTAVEFALHDPRSPRHIARRRLHVGFQKRAGACHDPVAALACINAAHCGAHGVRRRDAPAALPAQLFKRIAIKFWRHGGIEKELHQASTLDTKALKMAIDREDHLGSRDLTCVGFHDPAGTVFEDLGNR